MFNTQFSVSDIADTARCYTELAAASAGVVVAGNASVDVSGRLAWNRSAGFRHEGLPKHDFVTAKEKTQMCIDMRDIVGYVQFLCRYKHVSVQLYNTALN